MINLAEKDAYLDTRQANKEKMAVARLSIISNSVLILAKVVIGLMMGSVSILSEAAHSGVDLLAAVIAFIAVRTSGKPADKEHPFGHGKIENISGTIEAVLIMLAAVWIISEAIGRLLHPQPLQAVPWGVGVMLFSCVVNFVVSRKLFRTAEKTDSVALKADAWHLMTDVYTSAGVMGGLFIILVAEMIMPGRNFHWIDPVAAIGVALLIMHAAWTLTVQSARDLLDFTLPSYEKTIIRELIAGKSQEVHGYHKLHTRKSGSYRFVEFHMLVDPGMSVAKSHLITDEITRMIAERLPNTTITIHVEPCDGRCDEDCLRSCMLPEDKRSRR